MRLSCHHPVGREAARSNDITDNTFGLSNAPTICPHAAVQAGFIGRKASAAGMLPSEVK